MTTLLVTVGTTPFDELVRTLDKPTESVKVHFQLASGTYIPQFHAWTRFLPNFENEIAKFDYVICHAGAGSVYLLFEMQKRFAVCSNLDRADDHQRELAAFLKNENHTLVVTTQELAAMSIEQLCHRISISHFTPYTREQFSKVDEILNFLTS